MKNLEGNTNLKERAIELIIEALEDSYREGHWSGWGIDLLLSHEGKLFLSAQNSNNNVYLNADVICRINQFEVEKDEDGNEIDIKDLYCLGEMAEELYVHGKENYKFSELYEKL